MSVEQIPYNELKYSTGTLCLFPSVNFDTALHDCEQENNHNGSTKLKNTETSHYTNKFGIPMR